MSDMLNEALRYAELGIPVHPLAPRDKVPVLKDWTHKATTDPDTIRGWWGPRPGCNIGGAMGEIVCIDFDVDDEKGYDSRDWLAEWESEHGKLPETATAVTGRGGSHLYYHVDRPVPKSENTDLHIDIRGIGAQAVLPPSIHPNGNAYYWDLDPEDVGIADADDTVYAFIDAVRPEKREHGRVTVPTKKLFEGEGRNNELYRQGCSARGRGADDLLVRSWMESLNRSICLPPLPEDELERCIASVCKLPVGMSDKVKGELAEKGIGKPKKASHVAVAEKVMNDHHACFLEGAPAVYNGLTYDMGWDAIERAVLREWPNARERDRKEVSKYLALTMPHEKQAPPRYIGFRNGVLDTETMELLSLTSELLIPNVIPHDWNPSARSDVLDATLRKIACGDPFIEANLCEFIGLSMFRSGKYAFAALLIGKQGENASNGKSTYIDLVRNVLGPGNYSSLSLHALGERFNQDFLAGKLANLGDDISSEFAKGAALEVLKKAVAGSEITTDVKNAKGYSFRPYTTMMFSANQFPRMESLDDGLLRRLFPVRFNAHFQSTDPDYDPDIGDKLADEAVLEAACVRGVNGLRRVIRQRRPTDNDESRALLSNIRTDNSTILQWVEDESVKREELVGCTVAHVYGLYERWCGDSGVYRKYAKWQFSKELCNFFGLKVLSTTRDTKRVRVLADARR